MEETTPAETTAQAQTEAKPLVPIQNPPKFFQKIPFLIATFVCLFLVGIGGFFLAQKYIHPAIKITQSPSPTPTPNPTADWKTYTDPSNRFTFKYPSNWTTLVISKNDNVLITTPDLAEKAQASLTIDGACHPLYPIQISEVFEGTGLGASDLTQTTTSFPLRVGGIATTAYLTTWIQQPPCGFMNKQDIAMYVLKNGRLFYITLAQADNPLYKNIFNTLLATFTFLNVPSPTSIPTPLPIPVISYTDKYFNYQISYPNTWMFRRTYGPDIPKDAPTDVLSGFDIHYQIPTTQQTQATIVMNVLDGHGYTDIEKWIDSYDLNYPKNATRSSTTFRGYPALLYTDTSDTSSGREYIYFLAGKYAYRITTVENGVIRNATRDIVSSFTPTH